MESWKNFRNRFTAQTRALLWAQWSGLGVSSTRKHTPLSVDLEALLLGTWTIGRLEPRLFDAALTWCCEHGDLIHAKRLEKLLDESDDRELTAMSATWSRVIEDHADLSVPWPQSQEPSFEPELPVFIDDDFAPQFTGSSDTTNLDPIFREFGWKRGHFSPRQDLGPLKCRRPQTIQLFCRKFIGQGRRTEVTTPLIYGAELTTAQLTRWARYSRRSIQEVLRNLNEAGVLDWDPGRGKTTTARLSKQFRNSFVTSIVPDDVPEASLDGMVTVRDWSTFYLGILPLWRAIRRIEQNDYDGFKAHSLLRDALEQAFDYHRHLPRTATYRPTFDVDSAAAITAEADSYIQSLFPTQLSI